MLTLTNAKIFDGTRMLPGLRSVTLDGDRIAAIGDQTGHGPGDRLDAGGMTVMPGLVTCHLHPDFYKYSLGDVMAGVQLGKELPPGVLMAIGVRTCRVLIESGFTGYVGAACAHDIDASLKMAIEMDIIPGPRIRACSHHVGTTGDVNASPKWWQVMTTGGVDVFADGPEGIRKLVREEIRRGAQTIKIFAGPGHLVPGHRGKDNMARDEIAALVDAAHQRGAKVRAHVCLKEKILECIELGVDIIDHADEADEEVIEAMAKAGSYWVPSLTFTKVLMDLGQDADGTYARSYELLGRMLPIAHKAGVRILLGDDYSGVLRDSLPDDPLDHQVGCYGREVPFYGAFPGISPTDVLSWATKNAGTLLADAPAKLGVIEAGALADLIIVDGDPSADLSLLARPKEALKAVIRNGAMVIDRMPPPSATRKAA